VKLIWVLFVILQGTDIKEDVYFNDLDTCLEYSSKMQQQDLHQRQAGDKIYLKVYCIPKKAND
tara:strand:+ start:610 stop:798 length:189 start_codon:yes stop_codon:yes gene_type:complete